MKIIKIKPAPCNCNAYAFPHRAAGGLCTDPGDDPKSCSDCQYSTIERDPYGTGDRNYSHINCGLENGCPWGND